jgi:hypothetical protein
MANTNARLERLRRATLLGDKPSPSSVIVKLRQRRERRKIWSPPATTTSRACSGSQLSPAQALAMAQELLRYQPTDDRREGWRTRIAELVAIANEDPAQGGAQGTGNPDPVAGHHALGAGDGKANKAKKAASRAASSPHGEPSCQIVHRALEDARVSLERRRENHDRAIDDIGEAGKNVRTPGEPIYNPGCLALTHQ